MNARCLTSYAADVHAMELSADQKRAEMADSVSREIATTMVLSLCRGLDVKVPVALIDKSGMQPDTEDDVDAFMVLFDHIGDDAAKPLLLALLRTNCQEARALVQYAAERHAFFWADQINDIRERCGMEP